MADPSNPTLIRARVAAERLGVHASTLKRWSERGDFPQPVRLGPRGDRFYRLSDIHHHLENNGSTDD
jgi:predicted DNA-binding transcriptional regulator AlpA